MSQHMDLSVVLQLLHPLQQEIYFGLEFNGEGWGGDWCTFKTTDSKDFGAFSLP